MRQKKPVPLVSKGENEKMETLIIAGGDINKEELAKYCKEDSRTKYYCC